jgi:glc operon protein GlcG
MRRLIPITCAAVLAVSNVAAAQTPASQAAPAPVAGADAYGVSIDLATAKRLLATAEAEARKHDWHMSIAVVDPHGELLAFERMDDAHYASTLVSQGKARTAARFRRDTRVFYNQYESGHTYVGTLEPGMVAAPGGFPLVAAGKVVGAIGCSGGTGEQDATTCKAAADTFK